MGKIALVKTCPICRTEFDPAKSPGGMCPRCLMTGGAGEESPAPAGLPLGREGYELIERIGRGGMGTVYRAWQSSLGRTVAVKVLSGPEGSPEAQERFENEARVLGLLEHPNIIPIHDLGRDAEGQAYYSMKLVKGRTLEQILDDLRRGDPLAAGRHALAELLTVFEKVCDAVAFAHSQGVLHRDLKPENIMVGEFGEVLVLDWGLAKIRSEPSGGDGDGIEPRREGAGLGLTLAGDVIGTPQYMSPEQAAGEADSLDERSDVFSLGGVLYALLTLHPPVEGGDPASVMRKVRSGAVTPPSSRNAGRVGLESAAAAGGAGPAAGDRSRVPHCPGGRVPAALSAVAMKALQVDKERRYQSVAALQADVAAYRRGFATSAEEANLWRQLELLLLRHRVATAALAVVLLLSAGFVVKLVHSERAAVAAKGEAEARFEGERRAVARAAISLAEAAYRAHDSKAMEEALAGVAEDLRDEQWQYLSLRADNSACRVVDGGNGMFMGAAPHPTRRGVFAMVDGISGDFVLVDAATGRRVGGFAATERQRGVRYRGGALEFSPDGSRLVSGRPAPGGVCVYDVASGKPTGVWPPAFVSGVRFHPDGSRVLAVTEGGRLSVHDAVSGATLWEKPQVGRAIFLPSGEVAAAFGGRLNLLDGETGKRIREVLGMKARIHDLEVSQDGAVLFLGGDDGWVRACKSEDGSLLFELPLTESAHAVHVALSGDGRRLLVGADLDSGGRVVRILDAAKGRTLQNLMGGSGALSAMGFHPLGGDVVVSGPDTRAWTGASLPFPERELYASHHSSAFWGTADLFLDENRVRTLDPLVPEPVWLPLPEPPPGAGPPFWSADAAGALAAIARGARDSTSRPSDLFVVRREGGGFALAATARASERVEGLHLNADGTRMAAANGRQKIEIFDTSTGRRVCECDVGGHKIHRELSWIGAGRLAGAAFDDRRNLFLWEAETGELLVRFRTASPALALAGSPDGKLLAEGGEDRRVRLRDADTLEVREEFVVHDAAVTALAFHPALPLLATGSRDRSVRLWSLPEGRLLQELQPSSEAVVGLSFSPDGRVLACADHAHFTHFVHFRAGFGLSR